METSIKLRILILFSLIAGLAFSFAGNANAQLPIETAIVEEQTVVGVRACAHFGGFGLARQDDLG